VWAEVDDYLALWAFQVVYLYAEAPLDLFQELLLPGEKTEPLGYQIAKPIKDQIGQDLHVPQ